jgi:hypothetical protein
MSLAENVTTLPQGRDGNYEFARFNALRHGVLSQYTVLPWEDLEEYRALVEALAAEHGPQGPTEEHLVEELAGVIWRKRRLRLGEAAAHHRALKRSTDPLGETAKAALVHVAGDEDNHSVTDAIAATEEQTAADVTDVESDQAMTEAFGEAVDPDRLERLARYEVHLDRKLERTVAMLLKLQELRAAKSG